MYVGDTRLLLPGSLSELLSQLNISLAYSAQV